MGIIEKIRQIRHERYMRKNKERLQEEFQIAELDRELWITFDGCYILPCSMLKDAPVESLLKIREMHAKNL